MVKLKRIYDEPEPSDGQRILVDRLWPRGVSKDKAKLNIWLKDVAPSDDLRHWFGHDPAKWTEFIKRYEAELADNPATDQLVEQIKSAEVSTLVFAAHDSEHNNAVVLKAWLEKRL